MPIRIAQIQGDKKNISENKIWGYREPPRMNN